MSSKAPQPPKRPLLDQMADRCRAEKLEALRTQAPPYEVLEAQLRWESAFRKMLQNIYDQKNGY